MNYIFYQTKTKFSNAGDALINRALLEALRDYGKVYANCSSSIPDEFLEELGVLPEEKLVSDGEMAFVGAVLKCAINNWKNKNEVYVFSGLGDVHGGGRKRVVRNLMASMVALIYRMFGVKNVRIGRSVGKITKGMELADKIRSGIVSYNYVRDTQSLERCKNIGIKNVELCPDMSWLYSFKSDRRMNEGKYVAVNMRGSTLGKYDEKYVEIVMQKCGEILDSIQNFLGEKMKVVFIFQVEEDRRLCEELYDRYCKVYDCEFVDHRLGLSDMEKIYGQNICHISNRMHSLLLGYKYGSLPIGLIDKVEHTKIMSTFNDCDLNELIIDVHDKNIDDKVVGIMKNREEYYSKVISCESQNKERIIAILDKIMK